MRRTKAKVARKKRAAVPPPEHWRVAALREFPAQEEFVSSDDEQYGIYNLFFQLRNELTEAIARRDTKAATKILVFGDRCLRGQFASDAEDLGTAAGVSLFEHIFEDTPPPQWRAVFSVMPRTTYDAARHYVEQWMGPEKFSKLDRAAKEFYRSALIF